MILLKKHKSLMMVCVFLLIKSSVPSSNFYFYNEDGVRNNVKLGDFIVRQGTAYESELIKNLSGSQYSHVGLIIQVEPRILIIHATTDDKKDKPNQVIVSTLSEFVQPKLAKGWAIYRNDKLTSEDIEKIIKNTKMQMGEPFFLSVKNEKVQGVYCTTLIANHLPRSIYHSLQWQQIDILGLHGEILYPNALVDENVGSRLIYKE